MMSEAGHRWMARGDEDRDPRVTSHSDLSCDEIRELIRLWWPSRHGFNAGVIRDIIRRNISIIRHRHAQWRQYPIA